MMKYYITVDGGTTNTRVSLAADQKILETIRISIGARAGMDDSTALPTALKEAIDTLLHTHGLKEGDIIRILASGMITSEFGLCPLPHLTTPAGISELHDAMHETHLPDISSIPFVFIRGVKTAGGALSDTDMMRGEEAELMGLMQNTASETLYILPGSHSKLIEMDDMGRITRFSTMLSGEMIASLSQGTILKDAIDLSIREFDADYLREGCQYAAQKGLNEALFKVRILKNLFAKSPVQVYSFFLGCVLSAEIQAIIASPVGRVVIGGKSQIKKATASLLSALSLKEIITIPDEAVDSSSALGVIRIYEFK